MTVQQHSYLQNHFLSTSHRSSADKNAVKATVASFCLKSKLEGSPWWSVLIYWECLSLVLRTHLLVIFTPHLLYCLQKRKCCLISCADGMKQHREVDQGTDTALRNCRGKSSLIHHSIATKEPSVVHVEQRSKQHMGT